MTDRTLILWRHAKSSWADPALGDFNRPLNDRGNRAAPAMAHHIAAYFPRPDVVFCSAAVRTRQTLDALIALWPASNCPDIRYEDSIYEAHPSTLVRCLAFAGPAASVLMVGHNPGLHALAAGLTDPERSDSTAVDRLAEKFPSGAVAVLRDGPEDWSMLAPGVCALDSFVCPKDLAIDGL